MTDTSRPKGAYPSGIFSSGNGPPEDPELNNQAEAGNDPSWLSGAWLEMSERWQPMLVCMGGTQAFRENAENLLPIEPREDEGAWRRRVSHAVLSPFTMRIAEQAAGLIMRKPIVLEPADEYAEEEEVDEYWTEWVKDIDGYGTELDTFARKVLLNSILMGHSAILVDFPSTEPAPNLAVERQLGLRPYLLEVRADQILGWRKEEDTPLAPINQIRINEYVQESVGAFGERVIRQIRVLERGAWSLWRKGESGWFKYQQGTTSLPVIPLAVTYSSKVSELISVPPLLPIANLNINHGQRQADLQHSLHVASMPIMYLKSFSDNGDDEIGLSANSAILLPPDGEVGYAEPASSGFESQQSFITELENQMRQLGVSTLFNQTYVGETAEKKAMDRSDSDSLLSVISQDLERCLQNAIDIAAEYVNIKPPKVCVSRDFDLQKLDQQQVGQYMNLWQNNAITHRTLLEILQRGETLPDLDIDAEIEAISAGMLEELDLQSAGGAVPDDDDEADSNDQPEEEQSDIRAEVIRRLKKAAGEEDKADD